MRRMGEALVAGTDLAREKLDTARVALGGRGDPEQRALLPREDADDDAIAELDEEAADAARGAHLRKGATKAAVTQGAGLALGALVPLNPLTPVLAAKSAHSSDHIIGLLEALLPHAADDEEGDVIRYIIRQKTKKKYKKAASVIPGVGTALAAFGLLRWAYKKQKGTQGDRRMEVATWLAERLRNGDKRAHAIVFALYGNRRSDLKEVHDLMSNPDARDHIFYKLRST